LLRETAPGGPDPYEQDQNGDNRDFFQVVKALFQKVKYQVSRDSSISFITIFL